MARKSMTKAERGGSPGSEAEVLGLISILLPKTSRNVMAGIGDDCAVVRPSRRHGVLELLKTDAVIEGVHYLRETPLTAVGWKALCRPLSDIAAMGGTPKEALITVAAPSDWNLTDWKSLYKGIAKAARTFGVEVVGGETVRSPGPCFLSVTVTGEVSSRNLRLRNGARPGDLICVTGKLGGSFGSGRHLKFRPRIAEGRWLGKQAGVTAMMDLSDGLGSDLAKLAEASKCSFRIAEGALPLHTGCSEVQGISDGEDYELLFTVRARSWPTLASRWKRLFPGITMTCIGTMLAPDVPADALPRGYDHLGHDHLAPGSRTR